MQLIKVFFLLSLFKIFFFSVTAQSNELKPDELLKKATIEKADTSKLKLLVEAANQLYDLGQTEKMLTVIEQSRQLIATTQFVPAQIELYRLLADYYGFGGKPEMRHLYADSMISLSRKAKFNLGEGKGLATKALAYVVDFKMEKATENYKAAIPIFEKENDYKWLAKCYKGLGNSLMQGRDNVGATQQYKLAAKMFKNLGLKNDEGLVYGNISRAFATSSMLDSAIYYNDKASLIASQLPGAVQLQFITNMSAAEYLSKKGQYALATEAIRKAQKIAESKQDISMLGAVYHISGAMAVDQKDFKRALEYSLLSREIHKKSGNYSGQVESLKELSKAYSRVGDYKNAYETRVEYMGLNDSLFSANSAKEINELNVKFQTSEKEKQIAEQNLLIANKNIRLRNLLFSLMAAGLLISLLLALYFQRRKTFQQSLITLKKEQDLSLLKALMTGEEKERSRLARELHDGLGGILAAAQMQISNVETSGEQAALLKKQKATELVSQAASESRRIAHNLLPETLLRYGLDEALKEYSKSITDSKLIQLDYESVGMQLNLDQSAGLSIYRIIQELVNNIIKHSGATEALVQLQREEGKLSITVEDNGKGFSPQQNGKTGIGLSNIRSRVSYLNGSFDIRSEEQKGTSVYIEIQLTKNAAA